MITKYNLYKESLLNKEILLKNIKEVRNSKPSLEFDNKYGTNLSQEYKFPFDLSADEVWNIVSYDIKYYDKYNKDSKQMILLLNSFTNDYFPYVDFNKIDINEKAQILNGMSSGFNKDDIIWFVIDKMYYYKNINVNNEIEKFPKQVQDDIRWVLSPKTLNKLKELTLQTNESLLNKIEGPSLEDVLNNFNNNPKELLEQSCKNGVLAGVKYALELNADIHYLDDYPLRCAASYNHLEIVKYLIEHGADINASHALNWSATNQNFDIVKYLIEHGADVNLLDHNIFNSIKYNDFNLFNYIEKLRQNNNSNESLLNKIKGPSKEYVSKNLKDKFNIDNDPLSYLTSLVKNDLIEDIIETINELDFNDAYIPYVFKMTYRYNKPEIREVLYEHFKINLELFNKIKTAVKSDMWISLSDDKNKIYNELNEIENILKYRKTIL